LYPQTTETAPPVSRNIRTRGSQSTTCLNPMAWDAREEANGNSIGSHRELTIRQWARVRHERVSGQAQQPALCGQAVVNDAD
jgi:hypothetical protein